jgi:hypothetical protein
LVIANCFKKGLSTDLVPPISQNPIINEITASFQRLYVISATSDLMDIQFFLNPSDETIKDDLEHFDEQIIAQFKPELEESDEEDEILPSIPNSKALEALYKLRLYEEQQEDGDTARIRDFNRYEQVILGRKVELSKQVDIRTYFGANYI